MAAVRKLTTPPSAGWHAHTDAYVADPVADVVDDLKDKAADVADTVADVAGDVKDHAADAVDSAADAVGNAGEAAAEVVDDAQEAAGDVAGDIEEKLDEIADKAEGGDAAPFAASPYGEGSHVGSEPPEGFAIKGNDRSMKYHVPGSPSYERTIPEVWFDTVEHAEAAGFTKPKH